MIDALTFQKKPKDIASDINDPNNYCRSCNKALSSKGSFQLHLLCIHSVSRHNFKKNNLDPNVDDPNSSCRACNKYATKRNYSHHLREVHQMKLKSLYDPNFSPDPLDLNIYCRVCKSTKKSVYAYGQHCGVTHRMMLESRKPSFAFPGTAIDNNGPDLYCAKCDKHLSM